MLSSHTFTAIDFETAQGKRWSICQIGLIRVENGAITNKFDLLVQPPGNQYSPKNTEVHGIAPYKTANMPTFNKVWHHIEPFITGQQLVAHNMAFDNSCLQQTLEYYKLPLPKYDTHCTYKLYNNRLADLCRQYRIPLNHHDALSDAQACAHLFMLHLRRQGNLGVL